MNSSFIDYKKELEKEVNNYETKNGDLLTSVNKQINKNMHTMQVKEEDYKKVYEKVKKETLNDEYIDLLSLKYIERILNRFGRQ